MNTLVLGASDNPDRYSYLALKLLLEHGHEVFPVHPKLKTIEGTPVYASLKDVLRPIDTVTVYVSPALSNGLFDDLIALAPRRVIFNPGTENPALQKALTEKNIKVLEACTLVLLKTGKF